MSAALFESISRIAKHEAQNQASSGVAIVVDTHSTSGSDNDYALNIKMRDTALVLSQVPIAVGVLGFAAMPEPGDLVVVVFTEGDFNSPIVVGKLYHPDKNPPEHQADNLIMSFPAGEAEASTLLNISRSAEANINLSMGEDFTLSLTPETATLTLGDMKLEITTKSGGRAELAAGGSTIVMKQDGDISISAKGKLLLEGSEVEIKGQSKVTVQGAELNLN
ncbi:MAG: hypothetical protein COA42_11725 [Alteromonadaceae bacterium]|nr:MAG: hypothetical protein COA42_11725 [Alteromonadaceae bacterium]